VFYVHSLNVLKRWRSIWPPEHWFKGSAQIVLNCANQFVFVKWDDRGDSEKNKHHRLNRNGGSDDSAQKSVTSRKYRFIFLSAFRPEKKSLKGIFKYLFIKQSPFNESSLMVLGTSYGHIFYVQYIEVYM